MGLLDRIKSATSALTGSGAQVSISPDPLSYDTPFTIRITAVIGDKDVQCSGVYLHIEGTEDVQIPNVRVASGDSSTTRTVSASNRTFRMEYAIAEAQVLQAGRSYEWTQEVQIPDGAPPLYQGPLARHSLKALAGIDCFGNDPDSGWKELHP
ncbi:MAG: hypothetical protein JJ896_10990 [Rhodothermales bacterium]|nr:hypothetical protein [Rhodothermales bacterium]MBO6780168.1 hypothetical protein [Rhodothermales bacterium]